MSERNPIYRLPSDLVDCIVNDEWGSFIEHPLVRMALESDEDADRATLGWNHKREALEQARETHDWHTVVALHERPYRLDAVIEHAHLMTDVEYWQTLGWAWSDTEYPGHRLDDWIDAWTVQRPNRHAATSDQDARTLAGLPRRITIWRGTDSPDGIRGLSWTISHEVACKFARRFADPNADRYVAQAEIQRESIIAFFSQRKEQEALLLPHDIPVDAISVTRLRRAPQRSA